MKTSDIAVYLDAELIGNPDLDIENIADVTLAKISDLSFALKIEKPISTQAGCLIVHHSTDRSLINDVPCLILSKDPKLDFAKVASQVKKKKTEKSIHQTAIISNNSNVNAHFIGAYVTIGERSRIAEGCVIHNGTTIGDSVTIGSNTVINAGVRIYDNVTIGSNCVIHSGATLGADGFGFVRDTNGEYIPFPQIGSTIIEDRVEIGANTCIDRGALTETRIGSGTKIDNLVQIAHNVIIGKNCIIAAQTGISGSSIIEDNCVIGGQVGIGDHVVIKSGAIVGSQAGILPGKILRPGVWWGTPTQPLEEFKIQHAYLKRIGKLREDVAEIKKKLSE